MKLVLGLIAAGLLSFSACKKTELEVEKKTEVESIPMVYETTNKAVLFEFTSTGCPGCGSWGKPTVSTMTASHGSKVVPMAVHIKYGDKFITPISEAIANNRVGSRWTPQLWVDNENATLINSSGIIDGNGSLAKMNADITGKTQDSDISIGAGIEYKEWKMKTRFGVKIKKPAGEDYYLAAYLMENDLEGDQQGSVNNPVKHNYVIMDAANGTWGQKITTTGEAQTLEFDHKFEKNANPNSYVTIILWKKIGTRYLVVDASQFE